MTDCVGFFGGRAILAYSLYFQNQIQYKEALLSITSQWENLLDASHK